MNSLTDMPQILIEQLGRPTGMFNQFDFLNSKLSGLTLIELVLFAGKAGFSS